MSMSVMKRSTVVLSFVISALFGIILVVQGLFVQAPISKFDEVAVCSMEAKKDAQIGSTSWHPQWFRARVFSVDPQEGLQTDLTKQLHLMWLYLPSLVFRDQDISQLTEYQNDNQDLIFEFLERLYLDQPEEIGFAIESMHEVQLRIDDAIVSMDKVHSLEKGAHTVSVRVLHRSGPLDLSVVRLNRNHNVEPFVAREHTLYTHRFGKNRTLFQIELSQIFLEDSTDFTSQASEFLDDIWFGLNEGRYLGRMVIEVHNRESIARAQERALALAKWLVEQGAPSKLITVQGYGDHWLEEEEQGHINVVLLH